MNRRGFTIVELMVSIVVAAVAMVGIYYYYATVQYSMREQSKISQAQLSARLGMELIASDLQRAGYLATPNSVTDPMVCANGALRVQPIIHLNGAGSVYAPDQPTPTMPLPAAAENVLIRPDGLMLYGNYLNANEYLAQTINAASGTVQLQPLLDYGDPTLPPDAGGTPITLSDAEFNLLFPNTALLRIVNRHGFAQFTRITGTTGASGRTIQVSPTPVQYGPSQPCGVEGWCEGCRVNVVNGVWYRIERRADDPTTTTVDESQITDLVRYFVDGNRLLIAGTREVVVEYAVDFQVWFRVVLAAGGAGAFNVNVADDVPADGTVTIGRNDVLLGGEDDAEPELVRSAIVRVTVRTRTEDPRFAHQPRAALDQRIKSFDVEPTSEGAAHVRAYTTEVELPNIAFRNLRGGP